MEERRARGIDLLRAALARSRANSRSYFKNPGLIPRLGDTVLMAVFIFAKTFAALSGLVLTFGIVHALLMSLSDADQATDSTNGAVLLTVMVKIHVLGLKLAGFAALLFILSGVLMPGRPDSTRGIT